MRRYTLAFVFLAACVQSGDETVLILHNVAPADGCTISAEAGAGYLSTGVIDVNTIRGYTFTPVAENTAQSGEGGNNYIAFVSGAHVNVHFADDALESALADTDLTRFEVPISGSIDPDGGTTAFAFEVVPGELINMLATEIEDPLRDRVLLLVDISIFGDINNGGFETQTFRYPVEVCDGCLFNNVGACSDYPTGTEFPNPGNGCNIAQDYTVDCCDGVCPAVGTM